MHYITISPALQMTLVVGRWLGTLEVLDDAPQCKREIVAERECSDDQGDAIQAEMAISRPTAADPEFPHNGKSVRISQREALVGELLRDAACLGQLGSVEASDRQARQDVYEGEELNCPLLIVAAEEPPMSFSDD